jgi:hypothetical protein
MWSRKRPGRADDQMRAAFQRAAFLAHVHAADAGRRLDVRFAP